MDVSLFHKPDKHHVLSQLLPPERHCGYTLRPRKHELLFNWEIPARWTKFYVQTTLQRYVFNWIEINWILLVDHKIRIREHDVTYIVLCSIYAYPQIDTHVGLMSSLHPLHILWLIPKLNQLYTSELELDFPEYIQYSDVQIADLCWALYIPSTG